MDDNSRSIAEDFFLHVPVNPKISHTPVQHEVSKAPLKVEMQMLRLPVDSQKMIMDTLKYIHGSDFTLDDAEKYKDKGSNFGNRYWMERGNLIVQGGTDYSNTDRTEKSMEDKFRMFALLKLESYGFHKSHCVEALDHCNGDIDLTLETLFNKYYNIDKTEPIECDQSEKELLDQIVDEKAVLESIYDNAFSEKEINKMWVITQQLDYLLAYSESEKKKKQKHNTKIVEKVKTTEKCRNFLKGNCKFGNKCRFSHEVEKPKAVEVTETHLFYLEIKFPNNCKYPFDTPMIFLKSTKTDFPELLLLHVCRRLLEEAKTLSQDGIASVYSITELLKNEEEIVSFINSTKIQFIDAMSNLFPIEDNVTGSESSLIDLPSHYDKGSTGRSERILTNLEEVKKEDQYIVNKFLEKQADRKYKEFLKCRRELPAWAKMQEILDAVEKSQIVVVSGETGCGKSTQIPQFLLDEWLLNYYQTKDHCEIICTQPRRLSAIGVAERVAEERNERVGNTVGYQIRLENKISKQTRLTFCTTGILLRRLESEPTLSSVSHIIVDEVHERSEESDFLLMLLKRLMKVRKDLKIVLMSATLNAKLFSDHFGGVPTLEIPGRTFPVQQLFLEDILDATDFVMEENSQFTRKGKKVIGEHLDTELETCDVLSASALPANSIRDENLNVAQLCARYQGHSKQTCKNLYLMDPEKINPDLIENVLTFIVDGDHDWPHEGAILVFLPGLAEIQTVLEQLRDSKIFGPREGRFVLVPLHSTLSSEEQSAVFKHPPKGQRKIVLTTNIAETSITIDDCVFVVDCGKMKEKRFDSSRNMESLDMVWVSRASAQQRRGRAGRVRPGVAIHLFTSHRYNHHLLGHPVPEIHRVPLEQLLLRIRVLLGPGDNFHNVLGGVIEPPSSENITSAILRLQHVGALDKSQRLTALGRHLAALPVDVRIGKLMLLGAIFHCVDAALTMAACLSYRTPFLSPHERRDEANNKKKSFTIGCSDHLTVLKAYQRWHETLSKSRHAAQNFAQENYLSMKTLNSLAEIKLQLLELLVSIGFVPVNISRNQRASGKDIVHEITGHELNCNGGNMRLLSAILCASLYPNVVKVFTPEKSFQASSVGAVPRLPKPEDLRFKTQQDGYVFIHPSSVNYTVAHFPNPYLVYQEKMKTSRVFIRDCTMVAMVPLVLFAGPHLDIELRGGAFVLSLEDGWIMFHAETHKIAEMIKCIRNELLQLLEEKIKDPCLNLVHHDKGNKIISTIVQLITKE